MRVFKSSHFMRVIGLVRKDVVVRPEGELGPGFCLKDEFGIHQTLCGLHRFGGVLNAGRGGKQAGREAVGRDGRGRERGVFHGITGAGIHDVTEILTGDFAVAAATSRGGQ